MGRYASLLLCCLVGSAVPLPAHALDLDEYPELRGFIDEMVERHGFGRIALTDVFSAVRLKPEVVQAMERPREALPWYEYHKTFLDEPHVRDGARYWKKHADILARAQAQYGVPAEVILAVLGVETHFGRNQGDYRVLDALTTLTLKYPPRAEFFRRELVELLLLARELKRDPLSLRGSYAGALGIAQFIPSSYRRYAVDFDGDQRRDLIGSTADAIGSVANFLKVHGWVTNEPISDEARLEGTLYFWVEQLGVKPALTVKDLIGYGVFPLHPGDTDRRAALVALEGEAGPFYRIGYTNFYAITRYNRSKRYAMAVVELSELIRQRYEQSL
jgi:membrane-bound lytic murein transglycosylase B